MTTLRDSSAPRHTPGPWSLQPPPIGSEAWFVWDRDQLVATVGSGEANAWLIFAAPEMYEALRDLLEDNDPHGHGDVCEHVTCVLSAARRAVDKAEGRA